MGFKVIEPNIIGRQIKLVRWKDGTPVMVDYRATIESVREGQETATVMYTARSTYSSSSWDLFAWQFEFVRRGAGNR